MIEVPERLFDEAVVTRRDIHRHPELGFKEHRTSGVVEARLRALGLDVHPRIATTGVVGVLHGARPGRTIMLRADMDALPMPEETDVPYRSSVEGVAHACGHDGHVAILLAAAELAAGMRERIAGNVVFCFQPAEEGGGGARVMVEEGVIERFGVERAYGLHLTSLLPTGMTAFRPGPLMASSDEIEITVHGAGGHASLPHTAIDPILVASNVVVGLHHIVSRQIDPVEPAVVSICSIHSGTTYNVIPNDALLKGTFRTFSEDLRPHIAERIRRAVAGICDAAGATFDLACKPGFPVTSNDAEQTAYVRAVAARTLGEASVITSPQVMGSEDFSYFAQRVPSCFFFLGSRSDERTSFPNHHSRFDIDERALAAGIQMMATLALEASAT
jgi:amidohydrolase